MKKILNFIKKNKKTLGLLFITTAFFFPLAAKAGVLQLITGFENPGTAAILVVGKLIEMYVSTVGWLVLWIIKAVIAVAKYNNFVNSTAVAEGWVVIRDVVNMFFIVILLVMAFGTIFQSGTYHWRKMLPRLLIMAVVINFSRTIAGLLIDLGQVVMLTFVNGFQAAAGGNFINALGIKDLLRFNVQALAANQTKNLDLFYVFVGYLLAAIMITVTAVVLIVMLMILVMRVVTLWFLIVLSPLAFLASVWPSGRISKKYGDWWDMFLDNILVGPILAFFLWLSLLVLGSGQVAQDFKLGDESEATYKSQDVGYTEIGKEENLISYVLGIGMLLGSLYMAQGMRSAGSGIANRALSGIRSYSSAALRKAYRAPYRATKFAVKKTAGKVYERTGARAFVDNAKIAVKSTGWGKALGLNKEHTEQRKAERDERTARAMGLEGRANMIREQIVSKEMKAIEEKNTPVSELRKQADDMLKSGKKGTYAYEAYVKKLAQSAGGITNNDDFIKYAGDNKRLEEQLRAASYRAGNKLAFVDFNQPDKRKAAERALSAENLSGQKKMLGGIKDSATKGVDGKIQNSIAPDLLMAIDEADFDKYGPAMQKEINDALLLAVENVDGDELRDELKAKFDKLNAAAGTDQTFADTATGERTKELMEEQRMKIAGGQMGAYRTKTLEKSDIDKTLERMMGSVGKMPALGGAGWQKDIMSDMYKILNATSKIDSKAGAEQVELRIGELGLKLADAAGKMDAEVAAGRAKSTGQFDKNGNEMSYKEVLFNSRAFNNLGDVEKLAGAIAQDFSTTGKLNEKKKEAAANYANVAARYTEDATGQGTKIPKEKIRIAGDRFDPFQGARGYATLMQEYTTAQTAAAKKLEAALDVTDINKRVKAFSAALNQLENGVSLLGRNAKRFSPDTQDNLRLIKTEIEKLRQQGAKAGKTDIADLKKLLETTKYAA